MKNIDTARALLATLRMALYNHDDQHFAETALHIELLLDNPDVEFEVGVGESGAESP